MVHTNVAKCNSIVFLICLQTPLAELKLPLNLKWRRGKDLPFGIWRYPIVVVFKEKMYIGGGIASSTRDERIVVVYDPKQDSYDTLPLYTYVYFSMAVVNDQLVVVGGMEVQTGKVTNKLGVWNEQSKRWTHPLPPMTTAYICCSPSVATHNNRWLVVIGGIGDAGTLSRVEILDTTESLQWYHAESLPHPCYRVSSATIGNMCYLLSGFTKGVKPSKEVFSVCLDDLISQAVSQPASASAPPTPSPWKSLPDTPSTSSTALSFNGALLAVGGNYLESLAIHVYQPSSNSWVKAGEMPTERYGSGCIVLPSGEVLVAGGGSSDETRRKVEIASIL